MEKTFDLLAPRWWQNPWTVMMIAGTAIVIFCLVAFYFYRRYMRNRVILSVREHLLQKLESLHALPLDEQHEQKYFYGCLTTLLKNFIAVHFSLVCKKSTDDELHDLLDEFGGGEPEFIAIVDIVLLDAQKVKFAACEGKAPYILGQLDDLLIFIKKYVFEVLEKEKQAKKSR